jgi:DNA-directed RNA polymerase subunit E'/Rpb7
MTAIISRQVSIKPSELDQNIRVSIINKLKYDIKNDNCSYENGYILNVNKILSYKTNYISNATNMIVFTVIFEANTLNPKIGSIFEGTVISIHASGFFVEIKDKIKVLVPISTYKTPNKDDILTVEIIDLRFHNKQINCIGILKI